MSGLSRNEKVALLLHAVGIVIVGVGAGLAFGDVRVGYGTVIALWGATLIVAANA